MSWPALALLIATAACGQRGLQPVTRLVDTLRASQPELIASYRGLGRQAAVLVGPGPTSGSERLYVSFTYHGVTLEVVAFDPDTAAETVFANPSPGESAARAMVLGEDGSLYLGTAPHARILKLTPGEHQLTELARPSETEEVIWDLAFGSDHMLYGATWPHAKLVQVDPTTGTARDLGRMDPEEQYARYIAADDHGFVYLGIGSSHMKVVAYEIASGEYRQLLPAELQAPGFAEVYRAADGNIVARAGAHAYVVNGWQLRPARGLAGRVAQDFTRDGRKLALVGDTLRVSKPGGAARLLPLRYRGNELPVFRIALGPDDALYASTLMPARLLRIDRNGGIEELGEIGTGELYAMVPMRDKLLLAGYSTLAPLMVFDPTRPFAPGRNPSPAHVAGEDAGWRPLAMVSGPGNLVYVGAIAGYGKLTSPLYVWAPTANRIEPFDIVQDQSISALTSRANDIVGGTSIVGGSGSRPTQTDALLFEWAPDQRRITRRVVLPGALRVDNLVFDEKTDHLYAFAGDQLYVISGRSFEILDRRSLPFRCSIWQSVVRDSHDRLWGLAPEGVFILLPKQDDVRLVAHTAKPVTTGVALRDDTLYFASGSEIYRYALPPP